MSQTLIAALQNPTLYPHPVERFEVIETHISWVLLTGPYAYKIKKPMDFGFLDFTSLDKRRFYCNEELRLNQRLTDDLYLEVLPITGSEEAPRIGGDGEAIEYLLKMRQFPQDNLLAAIQGRGELSNQHIDELAEQIAHFHQNTPKVPLEHPLGTAESCMAPVRQNFEQVRPLLKDKADLQQLDALEAWAESSFERLLPVLQERKAKGFIRECHGDIHLGNAALIDGRVVLFDCIEFNEPFRFTDVCADFAFLAMDLEDRGLKCHARRFVAESYSAIPSRFLAVTHGVSAVGKSQVAMRLVEALGAVRLRSDVERKRLFGEQPEHDRGQFAAGIYSSQASEATYAHLHQLAAKILQAGYPVVIDAAYLKQNQRQAACHIAEETGVPFLILDCQAPEAVIAGWLAQRQAEGKDPSDATLDVIRTQQATREPLTAAETVQSKRVDTHDAASLDGLVDGIRQRLPGL